MINMHIFYDSLFSYSPPPYDAFSGNKIRSNSYTISDNGNKPCTFNQKS